MFRISKPCKRITALFAILCWISLKIKKINPEYYELISLAQHYGIPTRFLDWTHEFYIAFLFAFRNAIYKIYKNINENKLEDLFFRQDCHLGIGQSPPSN